ncbi:MAG TPA: hypothetical protein VFA50_22150 [Stellaceae bacterium]|nr:hypothetical protein [Stellaceae bacterium]
MVQILDNPRRLARRRALRGLLFPLLFGLGVAAFTYGALAQRVTDRNDLLPDPIEAVLLGAAFALASFPRKWAIIARAVLLVPTFLLYLTVFLGKSPALPFAAAFTVAGGYAFFLTALSAHFAERPRRLKLPGRRQPRRSSGPA